MCQRPRLVTSQSRFILGPDGPLEGLLRDFSPRPQQQAMAEAIESALEQHGSVLCEAGTGTGKTLAYLVPCLAANRKTIISTATKTLQDQLFERDIPLVQEALGATQSVALLKGRANYVCLQRLDQARGSRDMGYHESDLVGLADWARYSTTGDIAEATGFSDTAPIWSHVTSTVDNCLGQKCDFYEDCFVVKARREAVAADVVVVNHHLLFADMVLREEGFAELLPSAEVVVIDEAHQVPDTASKFFGESVSSFQLRDLCRDSTAAGMGEAPDMPAIREIAVEVEQRADELMRRFSNRPRRGNWVGLRNDKDILLTLERLQETMERQRNILEIASDRGAELAQCYERSLKYLQRLFLFTQETLENEDTIRWIRWYETSQRGIVLHATPVSIAESFQGATSAYTASWVFTSATLSVNGDFTHFKRQLGIENAAEGVWESPFDYAAQAMLYLPKIQCEPRDPEFMHVFSEIAMRLIRAAKGRTFLLFTSYRALSACAEMLQDQLPYLLLVQGQAPRAELLRRFEDSGNAVLLGTATFWQGVDVRGSALSCVVIDKLPFAPPDDPITQARIEALSEAGGKPFFDYQIPEAVIALKQGAGRLIRDFTDTGVLVLCDPRLESRGYGKKFLNSLPPMTRTSDIEQVETFLQRL